MAGREALIEELGEPPGAEDGGMGTWYGEDMVDMGGGGGDEEEGRGDYIE